MNAAIELHFGSIGQIQELQRVLVDRPWRFDSFSAPPDIQILSATARRYLARPNQGKLLSTKLKTEYWSARWQILEVAQLVHN